MLVEKVKGFVKGFDGLDFVILFAGFYFIWKYIATNEYLEAICMTGLMLLLLYACGVFKVWRKKTSSQAQDAQEISDTSLKADSPCERNANSL